MAMKMIADAEANGSLKPGGTIIECTSGNTGMGLAIAAAVKGYRCVFTTNDKQSREKIDMLKALGAEVIVCPTNVEPTDPRSYYSVAERLSKQMPNAYWCNQYDNLSNTQAHYESTGPEIWEQTDGKITHLVVGVGTGGTISGVARYLKERKPDVQIWGIDTYGSVFKKYKETGEFDPKEIYPYITEGIGEDILPANVDFDLIDHFEKVTDKDGAIAARRLAREEGILLGYSAGSALAGLIQMKDRLTKDDVVVVIFHDHGSRYVGKIYNDDWMRQRGFLEKDFLVRDILYEMRGQELVTVSQDTAVRAVFELMRDRDISQIPVAENGLFVGGVTETQVLSFLLENPMQHGETEIREIMGTPFPEVEEDTLLSRLHQYISRKVPAVISRDRTGKAYIITNYDILKMLH
jgi:cystathionine beta-synthase